MTGGVFHVFMLHGAVSYSLIHRAKDPDVHGALTHSWHGRFTSAALYIVGLCGAVGLVVKLLLTRSHTLHCCLTIVGHWDLAFVWSGHWLVVIQTSRTIASLKTQRLNCWLVAA